MSKDISVGRPTHDANDQPGNAHKLDAMPSAVTSAGAGVNWPWRRVRRVVLALFLGTLIYLTLSGNLITRIKSKPRIPISLSEPASTLASPADIFRLDPEASSRHHPISGLFHQADSTYENLLQKATTGVKDAAKAYRLRRGRHPPPRFDEWVAFAEAHGSLIIEEFFDRIYHDLDPFWAIAPDKIRADSAAWPNYIRIRSGVASRSEEEQPFIGSYFDLVQKIAENLPDLDMPINYMDESRVLVPWKSMSEYMQTVQSSKAKQNLTIPPPNDKFATLPKDVQASEKVQLVTEGSYWNLARQTCPPQSGASTLEIDKDFSTPPLFPTSHPHGTQSGFVQNWTTSQDFCLHPHLRNIHGSFVEPVTISTTTSLIPIFSGSKLLANNDILLPAAMYWLDHEDFAASEHHVEWKEKRDEVFWRGTGSGGRNKVDNWTRFQRHRLVSLLNGTQMEMTLKGTEDTTLPHNFPLPNEGLYPLISAKLGIVVDWIRSFSDVAFYWLECFPATTSYGCEYTGDWYSRGEHVPMLEMFQHKYLPDIDGNSFSGRFRAFMFSNSLPVKATIYTEWHDSRLIPWKHFVPMDNTFIDMLSILEYLFQYDDQAGKIAREGREWAERVLRKEDMLVYVYRLLLEYARVSDPDREHLGYGQDLK